MAAEEPDPRKELLYEKVSELPAEDQEHIFERFYRVDKARSRETGGTGLGLSIVKQLVTMHGGEITVHSEPNRGSEFKVVFPRGGAAE